MRGQDAIVRNVPQMPLIVRHRCKYCPRWTANLGHVCGGCLAKTGKEVAERQPAG